MQSKRFAVSLIVTTYNRVDALDAVLRSIVRQSVLPDEVIVADDGSTSSTKELIEKMSVGFPVPLYHCWQEDTGFRVSAIRNKAIAKAVSDYIVMADGDMVMHRHFIRDHIRSATLGQFVQGRRTLLSKELTQQMLSGNDVPITCLSKGITNRFNACSCKTLSPVVSAMFSKQKYMSIRACNMACWRSDIVAVNGFNEAFEGWGREDSEFAVRLLNYGIRRKDLRLGGVAYHLYHHEAPRTMLEQNDLLLHNTITQNLKYCSLGIDQYLLS
jgi:GT2 family glycosyltransferase